MLLKGVRISNLEAIITPSMFSKIGFNEGAGLLSEFKKRTLDKMRK